MSYFTKSTKILNQTWKKKVISGPSHAYVMYVDAYYDMINFNHSIGDVACYILYVLDCNHWKYYLCIYVSNVVCKPPHACRCLGL
jgi:hypothetical protein